MQEMSVKTNWKDAIDANIGQHNTPEEPTHANSRCWT